MKIMIELDTDKITLDDIGELSTCVNEMTFMMGCAQGRLRTLFQNEGFYIPNDLEPNRFDIDIFINYVLKDLKYVIKQEMESKAASEDLI